MDQQRRILWLLSPMVLVGSLAQAQGINPEPPPVQVSKAEWNRLRELASALATEDGTRDLYTKCPRLMETFSSADYFHTFVAPWRPRLAPLPSSQKEAEGVDLEVTRDAYGASTYRLTYHHEQPANAITIVKSVWQGETLLKLTFLKGFANIEVGPASGVHRNWRGAAVRRGSTY